ncbi:DUF3048 domain-containing protein [Salinibacterium sp. SYSU T00001]|uniref:DUF3048 domain-containing protein n=1 Tax=Homoserinimonas sedimenticola TaxID=2986805 RepID=UPI00223580D4|nr:DUF3048 domain-containing protein [Salinibacterium sedimenticola]MCW4386146.1 DUF3048 domain-containing protein [Salinibacterium sedimenticola]
MAALAAVALLAGCSAEAPPSPQASPSPDYTSTYEATPPTELAPLRGTSVPEGSLPHAALVAKIDNHWDARPQVGLERTDIVYEELVEGGITRYVAVWHSDIPELLGPIRSIRPMDPEIAGSLGGIIFYAGGQPRFVSMMRQTSLYNAIHGQQDTSAYMYRSGDRSAPHNVIVRAKEFLAAHSDIAAPPQQFAYSLDAASSTAAKEGSPTATLRLAFSTQFVPTWTWDAASARYLRWQDGAPDVDSAGDQLSAVNVVTLRVPVTNGYGVPKTELLGSGEAWITTGGATVHGSWHKDSIAAPITLLDDRGITVRLGAGNTWVELVPLDGSVAIEPPA